MVKVHMTSMLTRWPIVAAGTIALLSLSGCPSCAPQTVGEGVARLTVRNVGAMVSLVSANADCGFASTAVAGAPVIDGAVGSEGTVTWTVTDCAIDLGEESTISEDCTGGTVTGSGKVTLSATKTVAGILTGDDENPVVPGGPDAATISITAATFEDFRVVNSKSDNVLTMVSGSITAIAKPRLAVAESTGACAVATPNVTFSSVAYGASTLYVDTPDNKFEADVTVSDISAQNGKKDEENSISGTMTVFGSSVDVTGDGALDPDYDAAEFAAAYACADDLATPESFECVDLTPRLADGAARLSIKLLGTVASLLDADTSCGFSSAAVQGAATLTGTPGGTGSITFASTACTLTFPANTMLDSDCEGTQTIVQGSVTVTGTKVVAGRVTGSAENPIVPIVDQPATITVSIVADDFMVGSTANDNALLARSGTLAGVVKPQVYVGADTGVCSVSTPNAGFEDVDWSNGDLLLTSASGSFALAADASALTAANGNSSSGVNALDGTITIDGTAYDVPGDAAGLDPEFDQDAFDDSWQCNADLADPLSHACAVALGGQLGAGAASLTMRTLGTVTSLVNADTSCGFSSPAVGGTPTFAGGDVGDDDVTATFSLAGAGCTITLPADTVVSTDCAGTETAVGGTVVVRGTKTVTGFRTGDPLEPIVPTSFKPATFTLNLGITELSVVSSASTSSMVVHTGELDGVVQPRVGLDSTTGACSISTPNSTFSAVNWTQAQVTMTSDSGVFDVAIADSNLAAQNGTDGTNTNTLSGDITAEGVPLTGLALPLDPDFDQTAFDAAYACTPNLMVVPDTACSFRQVLGNAAARLLVKAAGVSTSVVDGDTSCGFADATPTTAPVITGAPGTVGNVLLTADANCAVTLPPDFTLSTDCNGTQTKAGGGFVASNGTKSINGFLTGSSPPVFPVTRDAATLTMTGVTFTDFNLYDQLATSEIPAAVTVTGALDVVVEPIAGRSVANSAAASAATGGAVTDVYSNKTGVAGLSNLTMASGTLTIESEGKTFNVTVTNVDVDAFAGAFVDGGSNDVAGTLTVDGEPVTIAAGSPLVDPYDQAAFESTYSCNADLGGDLVPTN
ncbi:MAG: hypothetical protein A2138_03185 [Deltaproteobacteria bacterium RBG_16_71_12]|nr:MAG: hypothetical protein A2138_03185 [Deltaproteobacteria bacterium RBG_16_71_12]